MVCPRKMMNMKWQDKIPETAVVNRTGIPSIDTLLMQITDSMTHSQNHFYGAEMQSDKLSNDGQKKLFKDTHKTTLKSAGIDTDTWEAAVQDQTAWLNSLQRCSDMQGIKNTEDTTGKPVKWKIESPETNISCPHCPATFWACIVLTSHLHTDRLTW